MCFNLPVYCMSCLIVVQLQVFETNVKFCRSTAFTDDLPKDYWAISVLDPEHLVGCLSPRLASRCRAISYWQFCISVTFHPTAIVLLWLENNSSILHSFYRLSHQQARSMQGQCLQVTSLFLNEVLVLLLRVFYLAFFAITLLLEGLTGRNSSS